MSRSSSRGSRSRSRSNSPRRRGSPSSSPRRRRSPSPSSEPRRRRRRSRSRDSSEPRRRRRSPSPDGRRRRSASPAARHGAGRPPRRAEEPEALPPAGAIFRGRVVSIRPFGAFVALDGYRKHGLVHISQLAPRRVESVEEVLTEGQDVWVKVLPSEDPAKVSLSLRQVDQSTGADLGDEAPRRGRRNEAEAEDGAPRNADGSFAWGKLEPLERGGPEEEEEEEAAPKQQPNFARTGKLAEASNTVNGVVLKSAEPSDAAKPTKHWRLYVFKGKEALEPYHIHRQSSYLLGRERRVVDLPLDHPSCSGQHAVLQFRLTAKSDTGKLVRPYLMDLGSTNGSFINGEKIEPEKYVELLPQDVLRFGYSSREYVIINADV